MNDESCCLPTPSEGKELQGALQTQALQKRIDRRLARIEGQLRGVRKMVHEGRWCADVLLQLSAIRQSIQSTSSELLTEHLRHCVKTTLESDQSAEIREKTMEELVSLFRKT